MAFDQSTVEGDVADLLNDSGHVKWSSSQIRYCIGQALGEISHAAGELLYLKDYDGAAATTVPAILESALVSGAAGFAAALRVGSRADWESQSKGEPERLSTWGAARLSEFRNQVRGMYHSETRTHTQRTTTTPWGAWSDDFGEVGKDDLS